jgi:sulfatase maturation enzyme AslB (radical SAM superfamily)
MATTAKQLTSWRNMERVILHEHVPLPQPAIVNIEASSVCNLKCEFCVQSLSPELKRVRGVDIGLMTKDVFIKVCEQLSKFPEPIKEIAFCNNGEPLLNKNLAQTLVLNFRQTKLVGLILIL